MTKFTLANNIYDYKTEKDYPLEDIEGIVDIL